MLLHTMVNMQNHFRTQAMGANKRARTRGLLLDCAIDVFSDKGIESASINEITAVAGLANGTFYNHFKDKDELAQASARAIVVEIARELDDAMGSLERGVSRVVVASWAFLRLALEHPAWANVVVEQYQRYQFQGEKRDGEPEAFDYMRADIAQAKAQGEIKVEVDDFLLVQISALMVASLRMMLKHGVQQELLNRTCEHVLRLLGLTPAQAKREIERVADHPLLGR